MKLRLIRHATLQLELAGQHLLVDPLLAEPSAYRSLTVGQTAAQNPTAPLPCAVDALLQPDLIVATHSHFDHFDAVATARLPKSAPLICQPVDEAHFRGAGFAKVMAVGALPLTVGDLQFTRTGGRHGRGLLGRAMGPVSGFVIRARQAPVLYIVGDAVWGPEVQAALEQHRPDVVVVNAGAAQFNVGGPITMTAEDVVAVCRAAPQARVVAVHMEAINHCRLTRPALAGHLAQAGVSGQVLIPADGELLAG